MSSSLVIVVKSGRSSGDLSRFIKDTSEPREEARALEHLFARLAGGLETGSSFDVSSSANAPVRASGTIALTYASVAANDTVTIGAVTLTCSSTTTDGTHFKKVTDGPTTAANLASCINQNTTLSKIGVATVSSATVTFTLFAAGVVGNQVALATSNSSGFTLSGSGYLTSGAGGSEAAATSYSRGL